MTSSWLVVLGLVPPEVGFSLPLYVSVLQEGYNTSKYILFIQKVIKRNKINWTFYRSASFCEIKTPLKCSEE